MCREWVSYKATSGSEHLDSATTTVSVSSSLLWIFDFPSVPLPKCFHDSISAFPESTPSHASVGAFPESLFCASINAFPQVCAFLASVGAFSKSVPSVLLSVLFPLCRQCTCILQEMACLCVPAVWLEVSVWLSLAVSLVLLAVSLGLASPLHDFGYLHDLT